MLFRKDMEPRCAYCTKGNVINETEVVCSRKGVVAIEYHCSRFKYDPFKRVPPRPVKLETSKLKAEDFLI
ncbi:MAG: hypothetical protein K2O18_08115 [Oscillospiraceae bacterium]|nr:hypothetical protein [Oscillospiraceae bacterium]